MKSLKICWFLVGTLLFFACGDVTAPGGGTDANPYLGNPGTQRQYLTTESWYQVGTDQPYFTVPESLASQVSLTATQLADGVAKIVQSTEEVIPIDSSLYSNWKLSSPPSAYRQIRGEGTQYQLADELAALHQHQSYTPGHWGTGTTIYRVMTDTVWTVYPPDQDFMIPGPYIPYPLDMGDTWARYRMMDASLELPRLEHRATVVGEEQITVPAGEFLAAKIHLTTQHHDPDYTLDDGYEYYAPEAGLVAKIVEHPQIYRWSSATNTTIRFRQSIRKELVSYTFMPE